MKRGAALLALIAIALAGCGGGGGDGGSSAIDLRLTLWPDGEAGDSITWTLRCEPTGGDHPDAEQACAALTGVEDPFAAVPPPDRCDEIPGGEDDIAVLAGDFRGRRVDERFTRENACVSGRWDRIAPVFPTSF